MLKYEKWSSHQRRVATSAISRATGRSAGGQAKCVAMIGQAPFWRAGSCVRKAGFDKSVGESAEKTHCNLIAELNAHALLGAETPAVAGIRFHTR